ncbi:hypothetical protein H6F98_20095 [Microcoleus sp. FACHB-SPT15]|uniref:CU044_2847 family protein n=1 Tax=Microcoleus sp. FACHB-SPT15 TaxID=2692830 RepID=UPI00177E4B4F|nr:CU044_2847 family protein [Microcoleus sp. FACHB-SPT15]MBD1807731.1 hypothetical protein [Microcoleus sp. FACHB-SPT15]
MAEVQRLLLEEDGESYEVYVESKSTPTMPPVAQSPQDDDDDESYGFPSNDAIIKMQQARHMIRGYTKYALNAFKDFGAAEIEEVTLKFGLKLGGKAGIPYITEGTAESNLEIQVKCKLPTNQ